MVDWSQLREEILGEQSKSIFPPSFRIPVLPTAVTEFAQKSKDPNYGPKELGKIVERDSGLTCELLKLVNSSAIGLRTKASSSKQAIALLGVKQTRNFLLTSGVQKTMQSVKSKLINFRSFWTQNLERGLFASKVAKLLGADTDLAYAGAMLQDFLLPMLTNEKYAEYIAFLTLQSTSPCGLVDYEQKKFGWNHCRAAAHIMTAWNFPDDIICCVLLHHRGLKILADENLSKTASAAVAVSALIPCPMQQTPGGMEQLFKLDGLWKGFNLLEMAKQVDIELKEIEQRTSNHISLEKRCEKQMLTRS